MGSTAQHNTRSPADAPGVAGTTMQAIVADAYGCAAGLRLARIARPAPADNEVLLRVRAAGLDRGTWHLMTGRPYLVRLATGIAKPHNPVLGRDVAGTVVAVGSTVTGFAIGDEVFGISSGSFAEYAVARENKLARKPTNATFEHAAAVPVSALTALQGLRDVGRLRQGQHVLVTGASGGVGSAGNPTLLRLRRALTRSRTAVLAGGEDGGAWTGMRRQFRALALSPFVRQRLTTFICKERGCDLERLAELIEQGTLTPRLDRTFPLHQVPEAMRYLEAGNARGKVAITI